MSKPISEIKIGDRFELAGGEFRVTSVEMPGFWYNEKYWMHTKNPLVQKIKWLEPEPEGKLVKRWLYLCRINNRNNTSNLWHGYYYMTDDEFKNLMYKFGYKYYKTDQYMMLPE